jgi:hypothetical protein
MNTLQRKLKTFLQLSLTEKLIFGEAFFRLGWARATVVWMPFSWLAARLGIPMFEEFRTPRPNQKLLGRVASSIRRASRYTPWQSNCLAQALAAQAMLQARGLSSTLYLGLATPDNISGGQMEAHAWLRCGDRLLTGARESVRFTVVATFSNLKGLQAHPGAPFSNAASPFKILQ